jgi:hypothetical protein
LEKAWKILLDYEAWNPTFAGAQVVSIRGRWRTEGELVLIKKSLAGIDGQSLPEFYAHTIKIVPRRHIVWHVYPKEGEDFQNFVDFGLLAEGSGVRFTINYYALSAEVEEDRLAEENRAREVTLRSVASAFKTYCETRA